MSVAHARRIALRVLSRIRRDEAFSGAVLARELERARLSPADAALAARLVYGTLAAQGTLDEAIDRHLQSGIEPRVRDALRMGAFELLYSRVPAYAVVDQAVQLVRSARPQAAGLANAVLRKLADESSAFPWGDPAADTDALARATAHPRWMVDLVRDSLGPEHAREMLDCGLEPAPTYVRLNPFEGDTPATLESLSAARPDRSPPDPGCYRLSAPAAVYGASERSRGWFSMDAAAQLAPLALAPARGDEILDVGAGRGNKTICMQAGAMRTGGPANITAVDVDPKKVRGLEERLKSAGVPGVTCVAADAVALEGYFGGRLFDAVLIDAPCTGLGTLRRYPEKRWRLDPDDVARMSEIQLALLRSGAQVTRPGGRLVYSTCSVARQENQGLVERFLSDAPGSEYVIEPLGDAIPAEWDTFRDGQGCFSSWPTSGGPDGHYVALLRRKAC
ncbi:MAG: methyltransferase domain-containing protein [Actinobacteria bacterium]|nr:methyltransferase domain-containing protein [Actinomycetota bacterium]